MSKAAIESTIAALKQGQITVLRDDIGAHPCSYLFCGASSITDEQLCFMVNRARGIVCAALSETRVRNLHLPMMTSRLSSPATPDFTASVESRRGVTTGISAADRARTLRVLAGTRDPRRDLVMPGHIFPISAKSGGVLVRHGIPEAAVDLLRLAQLVPVAALCHLLDEDGEYMSSADVENLALEQKLPSVGLSEVISYRMATESLVEKVAESELPTKAAGDFQAFAYRSLHDGAEHFALTKGDIAASSDPVLVRVQAENRVGDLIGSKQAPQRGVMLGALQQIQKEGCGIFVYVRHPRKGFLAKQVRSLNRGTETTPAGAGLRQTGIGAQILRSLGARRIKLLSSSTTPLVGLEAFDIEIAGRVPFESVSTKRNITINQSPDSR